jgi:hypothetical protein
MDDKTAPESGWAVHDESPQPAAPATAPATPKKSLEPVVWTASEFIENHKSPMWYSALLVCTILLSALIFFVFHDIIGVVFTVVVALLFAILGGRKPQQIPYQVDEHGITVNGKFYSYGLYKSFSILREGEVGYINLMPLKRFMPEMSIYFAVADESKIADVLAGSLPYDQREEHSFDRLMKKLHF